MVLGIRGQVSELELDYSIQRMIDARWNKAQRGELMTIPPAGYDLDDLNQLVVTPDESVVRFARSSPNWMSLAVPDRLYADDGCRIVIC